MSDKTCDRCGRYNAAWSADNDLWNDVMGDEQGVLCPNCFCYVADDGRRVFRLTLWNGRGSMAAGCGNTDLHEPHDGCDGAA